MNPTLRYAATSAALVAVVAACFSFGAGPEARPGILLGSLVTLALQPAMFVVARRLQAVNWLAGWGIGAVACGLALIAVGSALRAAGGPLGAPLLALGTSLFLTELVEPLFLQPT